MFRSVRKTTGLLFILLVGAVSQGAAQTSEVYEVQDAKGRKVYTNIPDQAGYSRTRRLDLPPLTSINFETIDYDQLRVLDDRIERSYTAMQEGPSCEAIRASSRVPLRSRTMHSHGRELFVAGGLLALCALVAVLASRRRLGALMTFIPLAGSLFLTYITYGRVRAESAALSAGLRACSEQLPESTGVTRDSVSNRLTRALDVRNTIADAYAQRDRTIEAVMRMR